MKTKKLFYFIPFLCLALIFSSCSDGSGSGSVPTQEYYGYRKTDTYHQILKFVAGSNGDNTYNVVKVYQYNFDIGNSDYKNRTGSQLLDMINLNARTPSITKEYTYTEETIVTIVDKSFNIKKGQKATIYYYY